ncbi:hypothetical protein PLANPX_5934 [Lacipirellula parvula]|uniref:Uncharacterized protein n=1 Tax=Lacipirellula parvula TaxID=2650471 RepID=A0A5K7XJM6_9BACT|nr:hypothetical protein PLANPX_5934 [Lacipirellula parvula]
MVSDGGECWVIAQFITLERGRRPADFPRECGGFSAKRTDEMQRRLTANHANWHE